MKELKGICVALCTPFTDDGEKVDEKALRNHIDSMLEAGVHSILVCGGTGEFAYLREDEKKKISEIAAQHIAGRALLVIQTSRINTTDAVETSMHARDIGADCLLILPPYFEGPNYDGVYLHYEKIAEAIDIPIMVYNIPAASNIDLKPDFVKRLKQIDMIKYIKDSTCDLTRIQELLMVCRDRIRVFNGADPISLYSLIAGCSGCVWGGANAMPEEAVKLYELVQSEKLLEAQKLWNYMFPAQLFFWSHSYTPSVKAATNLTGRKVGPCRVPQMPLANSELGDLKKTLEEFVSTVK